MATHIAAGIAGMLAIIGLTLVGINAVTEDTYLTTVALSVNIPVSVEVQSASMTVTDSSGTTVASGTLLNTPLTVHYGVNHLNMTLTRHVPAGYLCSYSPGEVFTVHPFVNARWGCITFTFSDPVTVTAGEVQEALSAVGGP